MCESYIEKVMALTSRYFLQGLLAFPKTIFRAGKKIVSCLDDL